ncbi:unnamed protein product, partial [Brenthis ino]
MLETEEVDIDYFTPASGTSLAKIFSSNHLADETEKSSLKYVAPLPTQIVTKSEDSKPTQCLYASALYAYEWLKDSYISKERVGFAIMKILKTGIHNIILYDSNKTTLSCLTLNPKVEIIIKDNVSISYYDNQRKYWNVYTNPQEYKNIFEILQSLNVCLKASVDVEKDFIENGDMKSVNIQSISAIANSCKEDKESDTDSSVNRKTKDSILKRMATMGQSVLPPSNLATAQTSDSSDTNEPHNLHKTRHKPARATNKRHIEKNLLEFENDSESQINKITTKPQEFAGKSYKNNDQQIVPIHTIDILKSTLNVSEGTDVNILMAEQRVSNSELRVNMNRLTDKVDILLDKVKDIQDNNSNRNSASNSSSHFHNEIVYKLLNEYEKKIKYYEGILKEHDCDSLNQVKLINNKSNEQEVLAQDGSTLKLKSFEDKDIEINDLKRQIKTLSDKLNEQVQINSSNNNLLKEVDFLRDNLTVKDNEIAKLNNQLENLLLINKKNNDITNKIKKIMNDTFQTISANFDNEENYTGAGIKSIVASIIKKTTMECLKDI